MGKLTINGHVSYVKLPEGISKADRHYQVINKVHGKSDRLSMTGWWFQPTPLKNMKLSWDDEIPNMMGKS